MTQTLAIWATPLLLSLPSLPISTPWAAQRFSLLGSVPGRLLLLLSLCPFRPFGRHKGFHLGSLLTPTIRPTQNALSYYSHSTCLPTQQCAQFLVFPHMVMRGPRNTDEEIPVAIIARPTVHMLGRRQHGVNLSLPHIAIAFDNKKAELHSVPYPQHACFGNMFEVNQLPRFHCICLWKLLVPTICFDGNHWFRQFALPT